MLLIYAFVIPGGMGRDGVIGLIINVLKNTDLFLYN